MTGMSAQQKGFAVKLGKSFYIWKRTQCHSLITREERKITMIKAGTVVCAVIFGVLLFAAPKLHAQFPPPPPTGMEPPQSANPAPSSRDISAEVERMTNRYGLSENEAKNVRAILEEQTRKAADLVKDGSLAPEEKVHRMLSIRDEEIKRVSEALTPEQKKKYLADVRPGPPVNLPTEAPGSSAPPKQ
jgi:hypothetical protein